MAHRCVTASAVALLASALTSGSAPAEMGPCRPADFDLICESGDCAARTIIKAISPSKRLAFAWRLANRPPTERPEENDPNLENLIVRIADGAVLAKISRRLLGPQHKDSQGIPLHRVVSGQPSIDQSRAARRVCLSGALLFHPNRRRGRPA